ncbi:MAG: class I SAM-dependent methyltransferase [bacterium]|nr:class I SAM-dependent methyltransferase [bacterium]
MRPSQDLVPTTAKQPSSGLMNHLRNLGLKPAAVSLFFHRLLKKESTRALIKMGRTGLSKSRTGISRATEITGQELSSRVKQTARSIKHHSKPENLNKDYRKLLHLTQEMSYDHAIEKLFFVPAKGFVSLDKLTIDSPNKPFGHNYHPIHRLSFNWAMAQIQDQLRDFTFVDYGAGRGRALILASLYPFRKIIGVEFASELHDDANMNIAQFPRSLMKCRDVDCLLIDAVDFPIPDSKGVFLFNDSFDREVLETVLARITSSYRANPRRMYLVFVRPLNAAELDSLMERTVIFEPTYHSRSEKIRMQILSPDQVQIFRTLI